MKTARTKYTFDPRLKPFFDAVAEMLANEELKLQESRRVLREAAQATKPKRTPVRDRR